MKCHVLAHARAWALWCFPAQSQLRRASLGSGEEWAALQRSISPASTCGARWEYREFRQICQHDPPWPSISCEPFPFPAACPVPGCSTRDRRHHNQSRSRQQVLLSRSHCLAPTPNFAAVMVPCDPASAATGHLFQVTKPDNKKNRIKM